MMENTRPEEEKIIKDTFRIIKRITCFYDLSYILKNKQDIYFFFFSIQNKRWNY